MDEPRHDMSDDELEEANGEPLPDREAMSIVPIAGTEAAFPLPSEGGGESPSGGEHTLPVEPPAER